MTVHASMVTCVFLSGCERLGLTLGVEREFRVPPMMAVETDRALDLERVSRVPPMMAVGADRAVQKGVTGLVDAAGETIEERESVGVTGMAPGARGEQASAWISVVQIAGGSAWAVEAVSAEGTRR